MSFQKTPVKSRSQLSIDVILFFLFSIVISSKLLEIIIPSFLLHLRFMFHAVHGIAGIAMCFVVAYHLFMHWAWIKAQVKRLIGG